MTEFTKLTPSYQGGEFAKPEHVIEVQEAFAPIESELADHEERVTAAEGGLNASRRVLGNTLAATLAEGTTSLALQVLGDSTGNDTGEWVDLLARDIASAYPAYEVRHYIWDSGNAIMPTNPTVIQASPAGNRRVVWASGKNASRRAYVNAITGDLDVRVKCEMANWNDGVGAFICGHFYGGTVRAWRLYKSSGGAIVFDWSTDGTNLQTSVSSAAASYVPPSATPIWIRATLDVDNGASGHDIKLSYSTDGVSYTQIGTTTTRSGTTSIFDATASNPMEIGARSTSIEPFTGSIYEVQIRTGIGGYIVAPCLPELWFPASGSSPDPVGSPIISLVNGSNPGWGVVTLDGGIVLEHMTPNYGQVAAIVSSSHNEAGWFGALMYSLWSAYCTSIRDRMPGVPIVALTQNPRIAPATYQYAQSARRRDYLSWEQPLGWTVIDTYGAFLADGRAMDVLVNNSDGIHPTAAGSVVWKNAVKAALGLA